MVQGTLSNPMFKMMGGAKFISWIKEQETGLTLHKHDDDDDV